MPACDLRQNGATAMGRSIMPSDLNIKAVHPVLNTSEEPAGPRSEIFAPPAQAPSAPSTPLAANPSFRFDPASGLVVIEFHDGAGEITTSIPTLRQLEAYRIWGQPMQSEVPTTSALHVSSTHKI
jgi:hypothetical protein